MYTHSSSTVCSRTTRRRLQFHAALTPDAADGADGLAAIAPGVQWLLARHGCDPNDEHGASDRFAETTPLLAGLTAASVPGMVALGGTPGARPRRLGEARVGRGEPAPGACRARWEGFDLYAGLRVPGRAARAARARVSLRATPAGGWGAPASSNRSWWRSGSRAAGAIAKRFEDAFLLREEREHHDRQVGWRSRSTRTPCAGETGKVEVEQQETGSRPRQPFPRAKASGLTVRHRRWRS